MSYKTKGIDISRWQGSPDFSKVKAKVDYVIAQIGYGKYSSQVDSSFNYNYTNCKANNIPIGGYWYSYAKSVDEARQEAQACVALIKGKKFEYPIYYDLEEGLGNLGRSLVSNIAIAFCTELEKNGYFAGIYISRSPAQAYLTDDVVKKYALWLAEYSSQLNWSGPVGMWQYSSTGRIDGINGNVDMNYCYEDYPNLIKSNGLNGYPKPEEPTKPLDSVIWYKKGDKDKSGEHNIFCIKQRLKGLGYKVDDTGGFGGGTEEAVKDVQRKMGYKPTGEVGENFVRLVMK